MGDDILKPLRQANNLSVVEIWLVEGSNPFEDALSLLLAKRNTWKTEFIDALKNSPFKGRKFFRWNAAKTRASSGRDYRYFREVLEAGELEVLPDSSP